MGRQEEIANERIKKINKLRESGIDPYPNKYERDAYSEELQVKYKSLKSDTKKKDSYKVAGRLMSFRDIGKISFGTIKDQRGSIQIILQEGETPDKIIKFFRDFIDSGDFIGVKGKIFRTKRGELSLIVEDVKILTKSIYPLPDKWHGIENEEERLRKRYLDILMNDELREKFIRKSKFWQTIRQFLISKEFLEVETPILENSAGGASATPFKTHHNALNSDVYLRISMGELWQKKLMVAGYDKTFEIGRQFRNEGMDSEHLQDYTQMEFYWGYANFEDGMKLVQELYIDIAKKVFGKTNFSFNEHEFDISKTWKKIDYGETIKKETGIDIFSSKKQDIEKKLRELKEDFQPGLEKGRLMDILWKHCRRKISGPAFLVGQPVEVSPLAKRDSKDNRKVEQFQIILGGSEVGNGYSELNDPIDQEKRFKEQKELKEKGDSEAHEHDEEFIEALKYGMPPTCGFGFSERLCSVFEGGSIRENVIFPLMKPLNKKGG